ncbi:uncharacterized protein LOC128952467 [Oppia nitens]|uniref:uncharacterized protein LOC128952467 n=1 Tax=Oppia nitens TaxID=1686743 RepID=UPI0023DA91A3|nr:uncharacterized protein LOC128952467 [Oppia nitens]
MTEDIECEVEYDDHVIDHFIEEVQEEEVLAEEIDQQEIGGHESGQQEDDDDEDDDEEDRDDEVDDDPDDEQNGEFDDEKGEADGPGEWSAFTGLRSKQFSSEELANFRRPFELGWKREVVLRGTVTTSGKKIGDVYYFSCDKKTKLRSYVEMGLFLKRAPDCQLEPKNFTFARQPIFRPPQEIVRHAMQRGGGPHALQPSHIIDSAPFAPQMPETPEKSEPSSGGQSPVASRSARNSTASESEETARSLAEGRAKRKRVAPTRFEDEDYSESPLKKKSSKGVPNGQPIASTSAKTAFVSTKQTNSGQKPSLQEKRRQLQHQLLQQVHEQSLRKEKEQMQAKEQLRDHVKEQTNGQLIPSNETTEEAPEVKPEAEIDSKNESKTEKPEKMNARKSIAPPPKPRDEDVSSKPEVKEAEISDKSEAEGVSEAAAGAPCSMHCPGRRGMLPNLMCSRCFCLYHLDCVPGGVFLEEPRVFVCPNCLKPEDSRKQEKLQNGFSETPDNTLLSKTSLLVSSTPLLMSTSSGQRPQKTFAPILPKPPNLSQNPIFQQMALKKKPFVANSQNLSQPFKMTNRMPTGQHIRVATGPNGHSMVVKDKSIRPKVKPFSARKSIANGHNSRPSLPSLAVYRPAPIAPIGPMKHTPAELERQLRRFLRPNPRKRRGYREWLERRRPTVDALLAPTAALNRVLSYLSVTDLVQLRAVSRVWRHLVSQPHLWRRLLLKGVSVQDWAWLARNVIETNASQELDFDGIKTGVEVVDFWRNFGQLVDYIRSVRTLRFGTVPTFVLEEVVSAAETENPYNSFSFLERISVKNAFDEESDGKPVSLHFLSSFAALKALTDLSLNSKVGFSCEDRIEDLLKTVFESMHLERLVLTSLKDFQNQQFVFLQSLRNLRHLEIGSCVHWFDDMIDESLSGAFVHLGALEGLQTLRLVDIHIDDQSESLPQTLQLLRHLSALTFDNLRIDPSGSAVVDSLVVVLRGLPLNTFAISTSDALTNARALDLLKKLDSCAHLHWKVAVAVEDSGECFVPFATEETGEEADAEDASEKEKVEKSVKYRDLTFLNEILQSELQKASLEIIPQ